MPRAQPLLIGVDTGGTFTDFVCLGADGLRVLKRPSTPNNPARAVLEGLRALVGRTPGRDVRITYGTTVATNAVLERRGARVVLLATAGFEDVLEIGRQTRPELYALEPRRPAPLVPRARRVGVAERVAADGAVLQALSATGVRRAVAAARRMGAESVAVALLHAYANPAHERRLGAALRAAGIDCSLAHELVAEFREVERTSTVVVNAYVAPVMRRHLAELARGVGRAGLRVLQSTGGALSAATAGREAVRTLLSGPAGGVIGAHAAARRNGLTRVITLDMGGTSTDVALLDGAPRQQREWSIGDLPVKVPAIDIHTVGAGGGSLARRDAGGALVVGPESAGADPGPACYGRGDAPTVTDADLLLGRLAADAFLGGTMRLDAARAQRAVARLARRLGCGVAPAAEGIVAVVEADMERAVRRISVERGHDPRDYALVAFGGAAGMHACALAEALRLPAVLVPRHPGALSAAGAVAAELRRDYVQTIRLTDPPARQLEARLRPLRARARRELRAEGAAPGAVRLSAELDVRYRGQSHELAVPLTAGYRGAFHAAHRARYGHAEPARAVEVVNLRLSAVAPGAVSVPHRAMRSPGPTTAPAVAHRLRWGGRWLRGRRLERDALPRAGAVRGPLLITELTATTVVPPGWSVRRTPHDDLLLTRTGGAGAPPSRARVRGGRGAVAPRPTRRGGATPARAGVRR